MSTIVLAAVTIIGTFGFMIFMRRRLDTQYAHLQAGAVAQRLGMRLVEGDPAHNLATRSVLPSVQNTGNAKGFLKQMAKTQFGGKLGEFRLQMSGRPYNMDTELVLFVREDLEVGYSSNTTTTWSDCRVTVRAQCNVTPFEITLEKPMTGLEPRCNERPMPAQPWGEPALDQTLVIQTYDPQLPRALARAIAPLAGHAYVHVTGSSNTISFVMTTGAVNATCMQLEQIVHVLASIAAVFEGKPAPLALPPAATPRAHAVA